APVAAPAAPAAPAAAAAPSDAPAAPQPRIVSVGPGGFLRQGPGDQQAPIPPAPPRRLVPAKPSAEIAGKTSLLDLTERICKWPMGHPGEPDFHFCGEAVNPGFPYCVEHCGRAYQAQLPRGTRRPPPPLPFGGPRVR
ncbi:MAG: GcrA family cell cycle regulator, partial [Sphingobium yanoikuyae]